MLHAGLDLSGKKIDVCLVSESGEHVDQLAAAPDADALGTLARRIDEVYGEPVWAVVESMTGARLVHDTLEQEGWDVEITDAQKVKSLAPLALKTDKIDSRRNDISDGRVRPNLLLAGILPSRPISQEGQWRLLARRALR
jgi:transposase